MHYTTIRIQDQPALNLLKEFLHANKLPASDINLAGNLFFGYHDKEGKLIGTGGLELYGDIALLRSVAVDEKLRSLSIGKRIVDEMIAKAKSIKIKEIYLLTETAQSFFLKKGFDVIPREITPDVIKNSSEFSQVCPASAVLMRLALSL